MSVTIHQTPESYTPSDNPIVWTFSSDQTAQPNFVYAVKVFINDAQVATDLVFPTNGIYAYYDASWIASTNCQPPTISTDLVVDANNYCTVKITIVERYGDPVADGASTAGTNITACKARMLDDDFVDWDPTDYIFGTSAKWLTNYPITLISPKVRATDEQIRLMFINNLNNVTLSIKLYDSSDNLLASGAYGFTSAAYRMLMVNATPSVIVGEAIGIQQTDFDAAAYYTVEDAVDMVAFRIDIDTSLVYDTYKRLHYLTQWGDISSWSFGLISRRSGSVDSHSFRQGFGEWSSNQFIFSKERGRDIDYGKTIERKMKCVSDWLTEEQQNWMVLNLYGSPIVYEENGTLMIRRRVTNKTIEEKIQDNDLLFLEEVTIDLPGYNSMTV